MRFKFCGDGDCPDWILLQINALARLSNIKMKLLTQVVADSMMGEKTIDQEKATKLTADAKFDEEGVKATLSALTFILSHAAKYGVTEATLDNELQQIGFPREHSQALCRVYSERAQALIAQLCKSSLRTARLVDVKTQPHTSGSHLVVTLTYWNAQTEQEHVKTFTASKTNLAVLLHDLKICNDKLTSIESEVHLFGEGT